MAMDRSQLQLYTPDSSGGYLSVDEHGIAFPIDKVQHL